MPRKSLIAIYKSFIIPKFDFCGIIYGEAYNAECKPLVKALISSKAKKIIWPKASSFFTCHKLKEVKLIKKLWIGISYLQDHISSNIVFKTVSVLYAAALLKLKQLLVICFAVPTTYMKEKPVWAISNLFFLTFWDKMTLLLVMFFSLVIPLFGDTSLQWLFRYNYLKYNS